MARGRAWGNALGGWRSQPRGRGGRFGHKFGSAFRDANRIGKMSQYRRTYKGGGQRGFKSGAMSAATYAVGASNHLRSKGFFINPEIGLQGGGVSAGYGRDIGGGWRGSIAIKVAVRKDNDPVSMLRDKAFDKTIGRDNELYNLSRYGVASTPIDGMVITRSGASLRAKSGRKAATAERAIPKKRAAQDKAERERKAYRAQRRNEDRNNREAKKHGHPTSKTKKSKSGGYYRETTLSNGTKIVNHGQWDDFSKKHNKAERHLEHNRIRAKKSTRRKSNKKGVASTITA